MTQSILILDCGATNVKACLIDTTGKILASHALPNETVPDPNCPGGLIWDIDDIWKKLINCVRKACEKAGNTEILGVTVTTFGVDGAAMKKDGTLCYPVISWQCRRTEQIEKKIDHYFDREWLYQTSGLQSYHFNTINKLIWLRENQPDVLDQADFYVFMPSIILYRLTGEFTTDTTMAGTSMLTDVRKRVFSTSILDRLGLSTSFFPCLVEPGSLVGRITEEAAEMLGIQSNIAVIAAGHDTQFALVGSGTGIYQPILSSGTWEILMVRAKLEQLLIPSEKSGITIELDTQPGVVDIGLQWVASGVLEWISKMFYTDLIGQDSRYLTMIEEAKAIPAGSHNVILIPELYPGGLSGKHGNLSGFTHETSRAQVYRACLEALSYYACYGLQMLQDAGGFNTEIFTCVGGGSKNPLWNQIRSDVIGVPMRVPDIRESTAVGAAMVAFTGLGVFKNITEAFDAMQCGFVIYEPGKERERYRELYQNYAESVFKS